MVSVQQIMSFWSLALLYLPFKMLKIPHVGPHLLKGSLGPQMRESVRIMVKWLNSLFPNNLSMWDNH